jgi:hypothetical protein
LIVPTMVVSRSAFVKVKRSYELHRRHAVEQVIETGAAPALPLQPRLLSSGWCPFCSAAANDDTCALLSSSGDCSFVFTFDRRVRDLKAVENTHRNMVDQVGQCAGHADKSDLASLRRATDRQSRSRQSAVATATPSAG